MKHKHQIRYGVPKIPVLQGFVTVLKKEFVDALRDTRSFLMMLVPVLVFPLLFGVLDGQIGKAQSDIEEKITIAVTQPQSDEAIIDVLSGSERISFVICNTVADALSGSQTLLGLDITDQQAILVYDQNSVRSCAALAEVNALIDSIRLRSIRTEIEACGGDAAVIDRFSLVSQELSVYTDGATNALLVSLVPMLIVMFIFNGGTAVTIDAFCGEKERGTLECLLSTQASRIGILAAKLCTVLTFSLFSAALSLVGCLFAIERTPNVAAMYGASDRAIVPLNTILLVSGCSVFFALFAVTTMIFLSITSASVKEGQLKVSVLTLVPALLGSITMYTELSDAAAGTFIVPILNITILLKQLFSGIIDTPAILLTSGSCLLYSVLLIALSVHYINSEKLLL